MAKRLEQALHKKDMQIANKHIKRYSTHQEMQIKATTDTTTYQLQ